MGLVRVGSEQAGWRVQLALRGAGLVLLAGAWFGSRWLIARFGHDAGQGGGDTLAVAVAFVAFAATSAGLLLATLGDGLMRQYEVPLRYRRH